MTAPVDNLVRLNCQPIELRDAADDGDGNTLHGEFAVFDQWTEINSAYEGRFMERIAKGAFRSAFKDPANLRVLFDHGKDPSIGNKPLGKIADLRETDTGARYEVRLFDAGYVDDLRPALRAGQLGSSFRFSVPEGGDVWSTPKREAEHNPNKLPERTITNVRLFEFGPVTFPAYHGATAGLRSGTDDFRTYLLRDSDFAAAFIERVGPNLAAKVLSELTAGGLVPTVPSEAAGGHDEGTHGKSLTAVRTQLLTLNGG